MQGTPQGKRGRNRGEESTEVKLGQSERKAGKGEGQALWSGLGLAKGTERKDKGEDSKVKWELSSGQFRGGARGGVM